MISDVIHWQESKNDVSIDCSLELRIHPAKSKIILLLIPGVDGTVDGYDNKYVTIAEQIQSKFGTAVVRMDNPFITSFHWQSNIRRVLEYIESNKQSICGCDNYELRIQGHSAGASVLATIAHEYRRIRSLLLINIAISLDTEGIIEGIKKFDGKITLLMGDKDPSLLAVYQVLSDQTQKKLDLVVVRDADHNFSGNSLQTFLGASRKYLFQTN